MCQTLKVRQSLKSTPQAAPVFSRIYEKGSNRTPTSSTFVDSFKLNVLAHDSVLIAVVLPHRPFIKRCQNAPIGFLPMGDILVVVEARNGLNIDPGF